MRGDVHFEIDGKQHKIRLTLGAMEEIQGEGFAPGVVLQAMVAGIYTAGELAATLRAGLAVTGEDLTPDQICDALGGQEAVQIAIRALTSFFTVDDPGNVVAAADERPPAAKLN